MDVITIGYTALAQTVMFCIGGTCVLILTIMGALALALRRRR